MNFPAKLAAFCLGAAAVAFAGSAHAGETLPAETLIYHAQIVPAREGAPDAVAIQGSRIVAMGKSDDLLGRCPASCTKIDAEGRFLLPGFHDSHAHLASGGGHSSR